MTKLLTKKEIAKCKKEAMKIENDALRDSLVDSKLSKSDLALIKKRFKQFKKKKLK